eukprot:2707784-Lingulodinium_polyedra.AAC.1
MRCAALPGPVSSIVYYCMRSGCNGQCPVLGIARPVAVVSWVNASPRRAPGVFGPPGSPKQWRPDARRFQPPSFFPRDQAQTRRFMLENNG